MQKVITINLNGNGYQLDEEAYELLRDYLDRATHALGNNPDLKEIMADLEQAIAEKCQRFLGPQKTVINGGEVARIIEEMGPVVGADTTADGGTGAADGGQPGPSGSRDDAGAPRRLYQIREGAWISGVCNGIAAYFHIDVAIVRVAFILLAIVSKGPIGVFLYLILMIVLPHAHTSEEHAAAHGMPFNAQELVDRATTTARTVVDQAIKGSAHFRSADWARQRDDWKRNWRAERRQWTRQKREWRREWRKGRSDPAWGPHMAPGAAYGARVGASFMAPLFSLASVIVFWAWAAATMSLLSTGAVFGRSLPGDLPLWAALLILILLYNALLWPLEYAKKGLHYALGGPYHYASVAQWDGMMGLGLWLVCGWAVYQYVPEVHDFLNHLPAVRDSIRQIFRFG